MMIRPAETDLPVGKRTTVDALEFAADHHFVAFGQQILDDDLVTWEGGLDLGYVLGQAFICDEALNQFQ